MSAVAPNHEFVLTRCKLLAKPGARMLDYGCGGGAVVEAGRARGLDMFGVEAFYEGGDTRNEVVSGGLQWDVVRELVGSTIPFPDSQFDLVVSNQVLEHVHDLGVALDEIARVRRRGGLLLALFPSREVIREGHCGVPFAHRICAGTVRRLYLFAFRCLGFGHFKAGRSPWGWALFFDDWLRRFTCYRPLGALLSEFGRRFDRVDGSEAEYLSFRLARRGRSLASRHISGFFATWFCRRFAGLVLVARKADAGGATRLGS